MPSSISAPQPTHQQRPPSIAPPILCATHTAALEINQVTSLDKISHHGNLGAAQLLTTIDANACTVVQRARDPSTKCAERPLRAIRLMSYVPCRTNPTQTHAQNIHESLPSDPSPTGCCY